MSYYKEINRAERYADYLINEILYINKQEIDLIKLELETSSKYACNFMKVFHKRLELHMKRDKRIYIEDNKVGVLE